MARPSTQFSIDELQQIIQDRQRQLRKLEKRRKKIQRELDHVDSQISGISGNGKIAGPRPGSRARNPVNLADSIYQVLSQASGPLGIGEITEKLQASGYRSYSENFRSVVNVTLVKDKRFAKASRGVYQLKGGAARAQLPAATKKAK